jgi:hypothetical protein
MKSGIGEKKKKACLVGAEGEWFSLRGEYGRTGI